MFDEFFPREEKAFYVCTIILMDTNWHTVRHWVVGIVDKKPIIIGYAPRITDQMLNLTKAQIQVAISLGLQSYLDKQYLI